MKQQVGTLLDKLPKRVKKDATEILSSCDNVGIFLLPEIKCIILKDVVQFYLELFQVGLKNSIYVLPEFKIRLPDAKGLITCTLTGLNLKVENAIDKSAQTFVEQIQSVRTCTNNMEFNLANIHPKAHLHWVNRIVKSCAGDYVIHPDQRTSIIALDEHCFSFFEQTLPGSEVWGSGDFLVGFVDFPCDSITLTFVCELDVTFQLTKVNKNLKLLDEPIPLISMLYSLCLKLKGHEKLTCVFMNARNSLRTYFAVHGFVSTKHNYGSYDGRVWVSKATK